MCAKLFKLHPARQKGTSKLLEDWLHAIGIADRYDQAERNSLLRKNRLGAPDR